jgi:hypothetical protein
MSPLLLTNSTMPQLAAFQRSLLASTQGLNRLVEVSKRVREYGNKLNQVTQTFRERLNILSEGVKATPYYLLLLARGARRTLSKWLTERLEGFTAKALKSLLLQVKTGFRLSQKLESLIKIFPTSSSVNP